ncbi:hypothetical protein R6Q57_011198 [Mikania cordata]
MVSIQYREKRGNGLGYQECEPPFNHNYSSMPRIDTSVDDLALQSDHAFEFPTESVSLIVDPIFVMMILRYVAMHLGDHATLQDTVCTDPPNSFMGRIKRSHPSGSSRLMTGDFSQQAAEGAWVQSQLNATDEELDEPVKLMHELTHGLKMVNYKKWVHKEDNVHFCD